MLRRALSFAGMALAVLHPVATLAADYPSKPVHFIVAFAPGVPDDLLARSLSQQLQQQTGQAFVVENRTGASGSIGWGAVAKAAPDGHMLGVVSTGWPATPLLNKAVTYDAVRDFTAVMQTTRAPLLVVVNTSQKAATLKEFLSQAQASPGKLNYGSAGPGSAIHLSSELFVRQAKVRINHVPYRGGSSEIMAAVLNGDIQLLLTQAPPVLGQIKTGRLRALAVTTEPGKRLPSLPDVPSLGEAGVPGLVIYNWGGIVGPAGLPADVLARLNTELGRAMAAPAVRDPLVAQGTEIVASRSEEFGAYVKSEVQRWSELIKAAGITIE